MFAVAPEGGRLVFRNFTANGFPTVLTLWTFGDDGEVVRGGVLGVVEGRRFTFDVTDGDSILVDGDVSSSTRGNRFDSA